MIYKKHNYISLDLNNFKFNLNILAQTLKIGVPASLSMLIMSNGIFFYNTILNQTEYPVSAIAAYSTAHRIEHLFFIPIISIATSMITLIGMFYGSKRYDLIDNVIYFSIKVSLSISILYSIIFYLCS